MKKNDVMTDAQRALVEAHLDVVHWVIKDCITAREDIPGMEYYDLSQEGCLLLMKAARHFDESRGPFKPFARRVIRNGLYDYCKSVYGQLRRIVFQKPGAGPEGEEEPDFIDSLPGGDDIESRIESIENIAVLESFLPEYAGVARKGIEAIIWKLKGYNGVDLAEMYGTDERNISAWITRARQKLLANERFVSSL